MNIIRITSVMLIVAGAIGLVYDSMSHPGGVQYLALGPWEFMVVVAPQHSSLPMWTGVGALLLGGLLLIGTASRR